jgi:hypothetical protein
MKAERRLAKTALALCVGAAGALPLVAQAQEKAEDWQFRATLYGWFPGLSGTTEFPSGAGGPTINVNSKDLLENLKMGFMGTFQAQKGELGVLADVFYADVGDDKYGTRDFTIRGRIPGSATANLSLDVKTTIFTLAGTYTVVQHADYTMQVLAGTRMLKQDQTLDYAVTASVVPEFPRGRSGSANVDSTYWDAIVGATGRYRFGDDRRWFVPYYLDIGAGNSRFTWQAILGLGYSFGWGDVVAAWRYTDYDFKSGDAIQSLTLQGPAVGVSFRW